jgi:hypothetical protein
MAYRTKFIDYDARPRPKTDFSCIACQRDLDPKRNVRRVHCVDGGAFALHPDEEAAYVADSGEMGWFPIGADCAKRLGLEWTHVIISGEKQ